MQQNEKELSPVMFVIADYGVADVMEALNHIARNNSMFLNENPGYATARTSLHLNILYDFINAVHEMAFPEPAAPYSSEDDEAIPLDMAAEPEADYQN